MNESGFLTAANVALRVGCETGPRSIELLLDLLNDLVGIRPEEYVGDERGERFCGELLPREPCERPCGEEDGEEPCGGRAMYSVYSFGGVDLELEEGVDDVDATPGPGGRWEYGTYCGVSGNALPSGRMCSMCAIFGAEFWRLFRRQKKPIVLDSGLGSVGNERSRAPPLNRAELQLRGCGKGEKDRKLPGRRTGVVNIELAVCVDGGVGTQQRLGARARGALGE